MCARMHVHPQLTESHACSMRSRQSPSNSGLLGVDYKEGTKHRERALLPLIPFVVVVGMERSTAEESYHACICSHACEALPRQGQMQLPPHHYTAVTIRSGKATRLAWPSRKASLSLAAKCINGSYSLMSTAQLTTHPMHAPHTPSLLSAIKPETKFKKKNNVRRLYTLPLHVSTFHTTC